MATPTPDPVPLPGGLVLRQAGPADLEGIGALLARRGEPADAVDHRLVVDDPEAGWGSCAVVVDGDRVVSTVTLLDEVVRIGGVQLPAGQVELVATDRAYEGRGLVRALMGWAHARSAARGHVVQTMIGIPYFYRLFGYAYAIDIPPAHALRAPSPGADAPADAVSGPATAISARASGQSPLTPEAPGQAAGLRVATPADLPAMAALQDAAQAGFDVAMPHSAACWRWLLEHDASTQWVLERSGEVVATCRTTPPDDGVLLAEAAALDEVAAHELLRDVGAALPGQPVRVVHRPGTVPAAAWHDLLEHTPRARAEMYYVRIPDAAALLDRLRPLLWQRLGAAGLDRAGQDLVLSTFGAHHRIPVRADGLGEIVTGGPMQGLGTVNGVAVAPDQLPALLFGPRGLTGLTRLHPDVYATDDELFTALFPPLTADLLTYYLP